MRVSQSVSRIVSSCLFLLLILTVASPIWAQSAHLSRGLEQIVQLWESNNPKLPTVLKQHLTSPAGELVVHVRLAPGAKADQAVAQLRQNGFRLIAVSKVDPSRLDGYLPLSSVRAAAAGASGIQSMHAVQRPVAYGTVGSVPAQAAIVEKADLAQARGIDGKGIKLGALSDSFDTCTTCSTHAAQDEATGDLPAEVVVLEDLPACPPSEPNGCPLNPQGATPTDEGRAMLQLAHKIAPGSGLGFATAFISEVDFSNNILALRENFGADVIVDDVIYFDEPMFSDGLLAQTVDQVVKEGAAYYSSAGNNGLEAYEDDYRPISFHHAKQLVAQGKSNLDLAAMLAAGHGTPVSVQSFRSADGGISITQDFTAVSTGPSFDSISFQWDEPFILGKVKTNFDVFVFDENGHYLDPADPNFPGFYTLAPSANSELNEAVQILQLPNVTSLNPPFVPGPGGLFSVKYQFLIANMNGGPARHVKYVNINGLGESQRQNAPSVFGHAAARNGQGAAAMDWAITNFPEDFSSPGPVTILFDNAGNRLEQPEIRNVPQVTAADGASTTFFGNFFGTSAAAPDSGAVAALVLQSAGGPGSIPPHEVYRRLQRTATPIPLSVDRSVSGALAGPVQATAQGDFTRYGQYFTVAAGGIGHSTIKSVAINVTNTPTGMTFNPNPARFHVGTTDGINPSDISASYSADVKTVMLSFKPGTFGSHDSFSFGLSVFAPAEGTTEEDADRMEGAVVTVTFDDNSTETGVFQVAPKLPINRFTGAGLVNADLATRAGADNH